MTSGELKGVGIGFSAGEGVVQRFSTLVAPSNRRALGVDQEQKLLENAVAQVASEVRAQARGSLGEVGEILEALVLMLEDPLLQHSALKLTQLGQTAEQALLESFKEQRRSFEDDPELLIRMDDLADLVSRVVAKICDCEPALEVFGEGVVLVGHALSAMQAAQLPDSVAGVVLTAGSPSSHAAIILRSRGIPTVLQCPLARDLRNGQGVLVDPAGSRVLIAADMKSATTLLNKIAVSDEPLIPVLANIGSQSDAVLAASTQAAGVGLFRTELTYLNLDRAPSGEQQTQDYAEVLKACPQGLIIARTFDSSPDKQLRFIPLSSTSSYSLLSSGRDQLITQIEALAAAQRKTGRELQLMAPLIADVDQAKEFVALAKPIFSGPIGVMVETKSLAKQVADLSGIVDFISVGSNDLASGILELTRDAFANHWEPIVIHALAEIASGANATNIPAGVCGESAADPLFAIVLVGLGFTSLSVSPPAMAAIRSTLSSMTIEQARELASAVLQAESAVEANAIAAEKLEAFGN